MAGVDISLVILAFVSGILAIFHKWMGRTFYREPKRVWVQGSRGQLEFIYLYRGAAIALVAVAVLLVNAVR